MNESREIYKKIWGGDLREMFDKWVMNEKMAEVKWLSERGDEHGLSKRPDLDNCTNI